jgi:hypothetical protein
MRSVTPVAARVFMAGGRFDEGWVAMQCAASHRRKVKPLALIHDLRQGNARISLDLTTMGGATVVRHHPFSHRSIE